MYIAGRLQYIKQVAKANVEMKLKKRRTKIAEPLWEKYIFLLENEKITGQIMKKAKEELRIIRDDIKLNEIENYSKEELIDFVKEQMITDARFFTKVFTENDVIEFRNEVKHIYKYPKIDNSINLNLLKMLTDSEECLLGKIVHNSNVNKEEEIEFRQ